MTKINLFAFMALLIAISLISTYFLGSRANERIAAAEKMVADASEKVAEAEGRLDSVRESYTATVDSMTQRHDSLEAVSMVASISAARLEINFAQRSHSLADSLAQSGNNELATAIRGLEATHDSVVVELRTQVEALKQEKSLLWARVEAADSLIAVQDDVNHALRASIAALTDERDAWRAKANPPLLTRLYRNSPALLTGAALGVALTSR